MNKFSNFSCLHWPRKSSLPICISIPHRITYLRYTQKQQTCSLILFIFLRSKDVLIRNSSIHKIHFQDTRSPLYSTTHTFFQHFPFFWYYPSHTSIVLHKYEHGDNMSNIVGSSMTSLYSACHCFQKLYLHTSWHTPYSGSQIEKNLSYICICDSSDSNLEMNFPTPFDVRTYCHIVSLIFCVHTNRCHVMNWDLVESILVKDILRKNVGLS